MMSYSVRLRCRLDAVSLAWWVNVVAGASSMAKTLSRGAHPAVDPCSPPPILLHSAPAIFLF